MIFISFIGQKCHIFTKKKKIFCLWKSHMSRLFFDKKKQKEIFFIFVTARSEKKFYHGIIQSLYNFSRIKLCGARHMTIRSHPLSFFFSEKKGKKITRRKLLTFFLMIIYEHDTSNASMASYPRYFPRIIRVNTPFFYEKKEQYILGTH